MAERNPVDKLALFDRVISFVMGVKTWKQLLIKIILIMVMFLMVVTWYKWTDIFPMIKGALVSIQGLSKWKEQKSLINPRWNS